jgi:hypothetical protein
MSKILFYNKFITTVIPKSTSDWLVKKYKTENKTLLYETVTYLHYFST